MTHFTKTVVDKLGRSGVFYYKDKKYTILHRDDGPAIEWSNGTKYWFINNKCHREDGPAVEYPNGSKKWLLNGKLHREDGPALIYAQSAGKYKHFYLNGNFYKEKDYWAVVRFGGFV